MDQRYDLNASSRETFAVMNQIVDLWCPAKVAYDQFRSELMNGMLNSAKSSGDVYLDIRDLFLHTYTTADRNYTPGFLTDDQMDAVLAFIQCVKDNKANNIKVTFYARKVKAQMAKIAVSV